MGHIDANIDFINGDTGIDRAHAPQPTSAKRERKRHINIKDRPACGIRSRKVRFAEPGFPADCGLCRRVVAR